MNTMIEERLTQCCVHVGDGERRTTRTSARRSAPCRRGAPLSSMKPSEVVARASRAAREPELVAGD